MTVQELVDKLQANFAPHDRVAIGTDTWREVALLPPQASGPRCRLVWTQDLPSFCPLLDVKWPEKEKRA